jgi:hypothetical protein
MFPARCRASRDPQVDGPRLLAMWGPPAMTEKNPLVRVWCPRLTGSDRTASNKRRGRGKPPVNWRWLSLLLGVTTW